MKKKPGYYVEGRHYGFNIAQARARVDHLTREYGRPVPLNYVGVDGRMIAAAPAKVTT